VYAIARERNLGIDVEHVRPESAGEDIAKRYFSAREVSDLRTLPAEARVEGFFHCWTRKEAYLKATGMGLQIPLDSFSASLLPGQPAQFLGGVEPRWHMAAFHPAEGYVAAVVYDGAPGSIKYFSVDARYK
jgi:4'-phosphopantetheinyl transferase